MTRTLLITLALSAAGLAAGCQGGAPFDANMLAPVIGQQNVHLLNAGGHMVNALALSEKDEDSIGQSIGVALTNRYPLVPNDNLQRYVNLVGVTVATGSPNPGGNWVFGVIDSPEVNAFSGPNGYVFVTRGALARMQDEAELAGVLAHEIAHVCNHDGLKQVQAAEQRGALSEAMKANNRAMQFAAMADAGVDAITKQGYSQPQELAADGAAVGIMSAAGYDPQSYFRYLQRLQGAGGPGGGQLMSTHPGIGLRIQRVQQQLGSVRPGGATLAQRFMQNGRVAG
jgi:predicted Zn-dependent protease